MTREQRTLEEFLKASFPELEEKTVERLSSYHDLVVKWNKHISLTTVIEPREFVERHVGEAIFAAGLISPRATEFWDIGSGLGIPGIPVAILRPDLEVRLVESNRKKAIFLEEAAYALHLGRTSILNARFESLTGFSESSCVSMRAVEKMNEIVDVVLQKAQAAGQFLIFGGADLHLAAPVGKSIGCHLMPGSKERFLYEIS